MTPPEPRRSRRRQLGRKPLAFLAKTVICAAFIAVVWAPPPAPAGAEPNPGGGDPNPFGGLSCSCVQTAPGSPGQRQQISKGILRGLSVGRREPNLATSPAKPPP